MSSTIATDGRPADRRDECRIRIAAAGDIHYGERADDRERAAAAFGALEDRVDLLLLAGDLTTHGEPEQAQIVADAVRDLEIPVLDRARQPRLARRPRGRVRAVLRRRA